MPVALETLKIAGHKVPGLTFDDLKGSLYDTLFKRFGIRIMQAKASIAATSLSERDRDLLQATTKTPCLLIKMLDLDQNGNPIMTAECIYRSDLFEFNIDISANLNTITSRRIS
jgi:GntR family transcriptional regulator